MREVELLRMVKRLLERGVIELRSPEADSARDGAETTPLATEGTLLN